MTYQFPWEHPAPEDENPSEREHKRLVASDNKSIVPLRLWLEAALIAVILAWSAINGFWILTHTW